jgi:hypothetical protein
MDGDLSMGKAFLPGVVIPYGTPGICLLTGGGEQSPGHESTRRVRRASESCLDTAESSAGKARRVEVYAHAGKE